MPDYGLHSGAEDALIYYVADDHSAITQSDGTTAASLVSHALIALGTGTIKPNFTSDSYTVETVKNDDAYTTFCKTYAASAASAEVDGEVVNAEAGTKWDVDADASGSVNLCLIYAGNLSGEAGKRFGFAGLGTLDPSSFDYTTEYKKWSRRTLSMTPLQAKQAITVPGTILPTGKFGASNWTIASGAYFEQGFFATT